MLHQREPEPRFSANAITVANDGVVNTGYGAAGPTGDVDRDGRLDVLITEWWPDLDSVLYRNTSKAGNFVEVMVRTASGCNPMGIGAAVYVYEAGELGHAEALIGRFEIASGFGYSSGHEAVVHAGVADRQTVDLRVVLPHGGDSIDRPNVEVNQRIVVP
jgi:hypothetical protein